MTCASCHPSGFTNGLNFDTLGDGEHGDAKNTPSLLAGATTAPFSWTGRFPTLKEQLRSSIESSLVGRSAESADLADLSAFLESLPPAPPLRKGDDPEAKFGAELFGERNCTTCHVPPSYTSTTRRDVGFLDRFEKPRLYNPPSLRGVGRTAPYLHDGRSPTLDDVLTKHHPGMPSAPSAEERRALASFLQTL